MLQVDHSNHHREKSSVSGVHYILHDVSDVSLWYRQLVGHN